MKKTLLAFSIIAAGLSQANATEIYSQDGTSLDLSGSFIGAAVGGTQDPAGWSSMTTQSNLDPNNGPLAGRGDISDASNFIFKITGKTYFNGTDGLYGIGHTYFRFYPDNSTQVREVWAGIGDASWGQIAYGKQYSAWADIIATYDIGLNFDGQSYNTPVPYPVQLRSQNTLKYVGTFGNLSVESSTTLSNGNYSWNKFQTTDYASDTPDENKQSGLNSNFTAAGTYTFGESGFSTNAGAYIAHAKVINTNGEEYTKPWGAFLGLGYADQVISASLTGFTGSSFTGGSQASDALTGNLAAGKGGYVGDSVDMPLAKAKNYGLMANATYTIDKLVLGTQYEYGRYTSIEKNALTNVQGWNNQSSATYANSVIVNANYLWNSQFSTGVEYMFDLTKNSSTYHLGNGAYIQAEYDF